MVDLSELDPATMARHLGNPEGEIGCVLADTMAERNWPVYEAGFQRLAVQPGDSLFEVGFGNGKLVPRLLALAPGLTYAGIDFSETMVSEAEAFNQELIRAGRATFRLASVEAIPFAADAFDRALAVNTIYFWPDPVHALAEIRRVLRPDCVLFVLAGTPEEMAKAPFTPYGFRVYDEAQLRECTRTPDFCVSRSSGIETRRQPWTEPAQPSAKTSSSSALPDAPVRAVRLRTADPDKIIDEVRRGERGVRWGFP